MRDSISSVIRCLVAVIIIFLAFVILPSFPKARIIISAPLVLHDANANGDACYVMAGGGALWERLGAAADLVQMGRVPLILLMQDNMRSQFNFKAKSSWTRAQWIADYLAWRGIPNDRIRWIPQVEGLFDSLIEARAIAKNLPNDVKTLVVVSSAPHMRRSVLAFRRSLPVDVKVVPYAATKFVNSYEMQHPLWIEYLKLLVYFMIA